MENEASFQGRVQTFSYYKEENMIYIDLTDRL